MQTAESSSEDHAIDLITSGRERLVLALERLQGEESAKEASTLVGQASDELGRAILHLRQLVRERDE
ncbi:MAG: hypothetical protein CL878_14870 [Dehalococcoidia bacterium]|nr:hypothetical protein [Dehalococcoidia bacterium]